MPRTPQVRVHYGADRGYLQRLHQAVEKDATQSDAWKHEVSLYLTKLEQLFLSADLARLES